MYSLGMGFPLIMVSIGRSGLFRSIHHDARILVAVIALPYDSSLRFL